MQNITISNSIVSRGLKIKRWEGLHNLWWYKAVSWTVNRNCLILITTSLILFCLWSLVNWLIVELSEQSVWGSRDLQTSFSQPQTAQRVTSVWLSCGFEVWIQKKRNAPSGEKIYIYLYCSQLFPCIFQEETIPIDHPQRELYFMPSSGRQCVTSWKRWNVGILAALHSASPSVSSSLVSSQILKLLPSWKTVIPS